jgi:DNA-binding transcriptional LysR family regulator
MRVAHRAGSFDLARAMVARGLGYSLAVQRPPVAVSLEGLPVIVKPLRDVVPTTPIVLGWAGGGRLTRRAEVFHGYCRTLFADGLPTANNIAGNAVSSNESKDVTAASS